MDKTLLAVCLLAGIACPASYASVRGRPFQTATVVSVRKSGPEASHSYGGDNPSDAPLAAEIYVYEVALHAGCDTYVARYASPYDYFPAALAENRRMPVQVGTHSIAFNLGDRRMQLPIAYNKKDKSENCQ